MDLTEPQDVQIDYERLFDRKVAEGYYGVEPQPCGRYYDDDRGLFVETSVDGGTYIQDLIQFAPDAFAFTSSGAPLPVRNVSHHRQLIGGDDWIHFCLRLGVGGSEDISGYRVVDQPSRVGTIIRYPAGTRISRASPTRDCWKTACLWLRPQAVLRILETSVGRMPKDLDWLAVERLDDVRHTAIRLPPQLYVAVNEILNCRFRGGVRRAFVYSKYLEILATLFQAALDRETEPAVYRLSDRDLEKIREVEAMLRRRVDCMAPLAALAREVGINRTKLVLGFRSVFGTSVEAYWREWRMQEANELLGREGLSIGEVAHRVGFSEVSSFTRAFARQFGMSPSERRSRL